MRSECLIPDPIGMRKVSLYGSIESFLQYSKDYCANDSLGLQTRKKPKKPVVAWAAGRGSRRWLGLAAAMATSITVEHRHEIDSIV